MPLLNPEQPMEQGQVPAGDPQMQEPMPEGGGGSSEEDVYEALQQTEERENVAFEGQEPASEEEQAAFDALIETAEMAIYPEGKYERVVEIMATAGDLYEGIGQVAFTVLMGIHNEREKAGQPLPETVWHPAIEHVSEILFQIAANEGLPGSNDDTELNQAVHETYRLYAEHLDASGDQDAIAQEAAVMDELMQEADRQGGQAPGPDQGPEMMMNPLAGAIQQGLER